MYIVQEDSFSFDLMQNDLTLFVFAEIEINPSVSFCPPVTLILDF